MTDYVPIDCGLHSEYELAIIQKRKLQIAWRDPDGTSHLEIITPLDLVTAAGEENSYTQSRQFTVGPDRPAQQFTQIYPIYK